MGGGSSLGSTLGGLAGGAGGFMLGGPAGAMAGYAAGSALGGGLGGGPQQVTPPDYTAAARQTAASNLANARVNQNTPYGGVQYQQTGTDSYGNPTWTANQTTAPFIQNAIAAQGGQLMSYGNPFQSPTFNSAGDMPSMNYYGSRLNQQQFNPATQLKSLRRFDVNTDIDESKLPTFGINPGQSYEDAIMSRLEPRINQQQEALDAKLANQGIEPGTEAYNRAMTQFQQGVNDQRTSAVVGGMDTGLRANQQMYGQQAGQIGLNLQGQGQQFGQNLSENQQNMAANSLAYTQQLQNQGLGMNAQQQAFTQAMAKYMTPLQVAQGLKNLSTPTYAPVAGAGGVDYMGAAGLQNQANVANANFNNAYQNSMQNGLFNLGSAALMSNMGSNGGSSIFSNPGLFGSTGSGSWTNPNSMYGQYGSDGGTGGGFGIFSKR